MAWWAIVQKIAVGFTWFFLSLAVIFHIYSVVTVFDRNECYTCTNQKTRIPWFVWYTSWCLWFTLATWVVWTGVCSMSSFQGGEGGGCSSSSNGKERRCIGGPGAKRILLRIATPWSITVTISYTYYLITGNLGRDYVDQDLCYTISDSAIPRATTSRADAITFLVFDRIVNITIHFACAIINLVMTYYSTCTSTSALISSNVEHEDKILPISCFILLSIIIGMVHTYIDQVYCTKNIWMDVSLSSVVFIIICMILFFVERWISRRIRRTSTTSRQTEPNVEFIQSV